MHACAPTKKNQSKNKGSCISSLLHLRIIRLIPGSSGRLAVAVASAAAVCVVVAIGAHAVAGALALDCKHCSQLRDVSYPRPLREKAATASGGHSDRKVASNTCVGIGAQLCTSGKQAPRHPFVGCRHRKWRCQFACQVQSEAPVLST